ncbi:TIGR04104 family putative zinc finger protein [Margalitia sp. FSL K6-0131]|uniref:TIGR04104 family putative zinc finger protein n=1 Tax=Margalitia sp. FSL K6-0131 TaxID=2954604 RepID=UPI004046BF96
MFQIPICQQCGYKWSWKETFVKMFTFKNKLRCPSCDSFQYVSKKSRNQLSLFVVFIPLLIVPLVSFGISKYFILTFELVAFALVLIWMPFLYKLSNKDDPMW